MNGSPNQLITTNNKQMNGSSNQLITTNNKQMNGSPNQLIMNKPMYPININDFM